MEKVFYHNKILFVGRESYTFPFYFLFDKWSEDNEISMFWLDAMETKYEECDYNRPTYYRFLTKEGCKHYTLNREADLFTAHMEHPPIDSDYLEYLEENYTAFKSLNSQILSDQNFSKYYHFRTYCVPPTYEQQLYWISLVYKRLEEILDEVLPDVILDCDSAELPRTVLNEVANKRGIPYITISYSRYEMYKLPSYSMNMRIDSYFEKAFMESLLQDNEEEKQYVKAFRDKENIKNAQYNGVNNRTYAYRAEPVIDTCKSIYCRTRYFWRQRKAERHCDPQKKNPVLYDRWDLCTMFWIKTQLFRRKLMKSRTFFDEPSGGDTYVYMPLHLIPESTTFSMAPLYINELNLIEACSKALPAGWWLYVKEHQAMLGERGRDFYDKAKQIPNVKLVRYNYYEDPAPWIKNAKAVVTISGTAAYEAALLGKPSFVFADVPFALMESVKRVHSFEELPAYFANVKKGIGQTPSIEQAAAYIKAVKREGTEVNLFYIMDEAYYHFTQGKELDETFYEEIDRLQHFFEQAYLKVRK